ncbi:LPS export ABC transporter periplasmic protein LptC [Balneola sp. MJW-20]|uniref:LPS export ABC transporter periplasmic protein LptC n=1 Tax=Gracilimonas aurantiaca TaxID=3234185 RepID=UPI0034658344
MVHYKFIIPTLLLFILISCGDLSEYENQQVSEALSDSVLTTTYTGNPEMEFMENNSLKLKLTGSASIATKNNKLNINRIAGPVHIDIYNNGSLDTTVDADSAVYFPAESVFEMFGSVKVMAPGDKKLFSDYLKWDRDQDRVFTDQFVVLITPTDSLTGNSFEGNSDLSEATITNTGDGGGRSVID